MEERDEVEMAIDAEPDILCKKVFKVTNLEEATNLVKRHKWWYYGLFRPCLVFPINISPTPDQAYGTYLMKQDMSSFLSMALVISFMRLQASTW